MQLAYTVVLKIVYRIETQKNERKKIKKWKKNKRSSGIQKNSILLCEGRLSILEAAQRKSFKKKLTKKTVLLRSFVLEKMENVFGAHFE